MRHKSRKKDYEIRILNMYGEQRGNGEIEDEKIALFFKNIYQLRLNNAVTINFVPQYDVLKYGLPPHEGFINTYEDINSAELASVYAINGATELCILEYDKGHGQAVLWPDQIEYEGERYRFEKRVYTVSSAQFDTFFKELEWMNGNSFRKPDSDAEFYHDDIKHLEIIQFIDKLFKERPELLSKHDKYYLELDE